MPPFPSGLMGARVRARRKLPVIHQGKDAMSKRICVMRMAFLPYLIPPERQFVDGLAARGYDVTVIKSRVRDLSKREEDRPGMNNIIVQCWTRRLPKTPLSAPLVFLEFMLRCILLGLRQRPDVVVAIDVDTLPQAWIVSRLTGAKLLYYSIELYAERPGFKPAWFWIGLERLLINKPDLTVACEPNRARVMVEKYGAKTMPMVILNVPPFAESMRTTKIQDWLSERGVKADKIVYYMGELKTARCTDEFIEAAKTFAPGIVLFFIGPIGHGYDPHAKIAACGVADRVFVHPPVHPSEVMEFAYSAHLGLQTQLDDGLNHLYCAPIKLFQYLMAGLPVIASNFPGMIDVVERNDVGLCVDPLDASAIADAINRVLADDATWRRMSENALRLAREKYCYEKEGEPLFEAVARLMA